MPPKYTLVPADEAGPNAVRVPGLKYSLVPEGEMMSRGARARAAVSSGFTNELLSAMQGASPVTHQFGGQPNYEALGPIRETDQGARIISADGQWIKPNAKEHVIFNDGSGDTIAYLRNPKMDEGALMGAGRLAGIGTLSAPVTVSRAARGPMQAVQNMDRSASIGVEETLGSATRNRGVAMAESVMDNIPVIGGVTGRKVERITEQMGDSLEATADLAGPTNTKEAAVGALERGYDAFKQRLDGVGERLYGQRGVGKYFKGDTLVELPNTIGLLEGKASRFSDTPNIARSILPETFAGYLDDISAKGGLSYEQWKDLRSFVGSKLNDPRAMGDVSSSQWKELYKSLSQDLESAASNISPAARLSVDRANKAWAAGRDRVDNALSFVFKNDAGAMKIYDDFLATSKNKGARANINRLNQIRKSMPKDEWDAVQAFTIRQLGEGREGFSPNVFFTNYSSANKGLSRQAKSALFGSNPEILRRLDSLADAVERRNYVGRLENKSRTGLTDAVGFIGGGAFLMDAGAFIMGVLGTGSAAALLTNPTWLRWADNTIRATSPVRVSQASRILRGMFSPQHELYAVTQSMADELDSLEQRPSNLRNEPRNTAQR